MHPLPASHAPAERGRGQRLHRWRKQRGLRRLPRGAARPPHLAPPAERVRDDELIEHGGADDGPVDAAAGQPQAALAAVRALPQVHAQVRVQVLPGPNTGPSCRGVRALALRGTLRHISKTHAQL